MEYEIDDSDDSDKKTSRKKIALALAVVLVVGFVVATAVGVTLNKQKEAQVVRTAVPAPAYPRTESVTGCQYGDKAPAGSDECKAKGCIWKVLAEKGAPSCQFPADSGYELIDGPIETEFGYDYVLSKIGDQVLYDGPIQNVRLQVEFHNGHTVRIKFKDNSTDRYEIPEEALPINAPDNPVEDEMRMYNVTVTKRPFGVAIFRIDSGVVVFNSSLPGMVMAEQFLQLTTKLASANVYGLGEHNHRRLHHDMEWKTWAIFTRDVAPVDEWNLYGAQPFHLNLESDGKANGVFLRNSNAMDVILQPDPHPAVTYRVIGGVLDFFVFLGDSPEHVVQLYTEAVGRPLMPPYWSLGFQLSRWNYGNLSVVKEVVERNRLARIPQDVQYGDIDYMYKKIDFTVDKSTYAGLPSFVDELHSMGQKYIVILDHALGANETILEGAKQNSPGFNAYEDGLERGVYVRAKNSSDPLEAEVWPGVAVYPDFTNPSSQSWWSDWCGFLYVNESIRYDGLWLDMNEPSSFTDGSLEGCDRNELNYPPYLPKVLDEDNEGKLFDKTICMDSTQAMGLHYNVHNLYGHTMAMRTYKTLEDRFPGKRPFALTRSNFAGTQRYAIHWLGDNQSRWEQMPWSIIAMLEYSIFGFSMTGSDICGFWYATDEEMCTRWTQLGAFYPYSRNHNAKDFRAQDPAAFSNQMIRSSRSILQTRYKFLPFLYTLMYHAHTTGSTVARPLFFQFPTDVVARTVDRQFMWGSALMISPVMNKGQVTVDAYFPKARWYDYFTGSEVTMTGKRHILNAPLDKINLHVKGGSVIPWQEPDNTTVYSRERPMGLLVALDESQKATGNLFWDDGESSYMENSLYLEFTVDTMGLRVGVLKNNYTSAGKLYFGTIDIFGLSHRPSRLFVDGAQVESHEIITYNGQGQGVTITNQKMSITKNHTVNWELY